MKCHFTFLYFSFYTHCISFLLSFFFFLVSLLCFVLGFFHIRFDSKLFSVGTVHLKGPLWVGSSLCWYNHANKFFSPGTLAHFISLDVVPHSTSSSLIFCFSRDEQIRRSRISATTLAKRWRSWSYPIKNKNLRDTEVSIPFSYPVLRPLSPQIKFCIEIISCLDFAASFNYLYCLHYFFSCCVY